MKPTTAPMKITQVQRLPICSATQPRMSGMASRRVSDERTMTAAMIVKAMYFAAMMIALFIIRSD